MRYFVQSFAPVGGSHMHRAREEVRQQGSGGFLSAYEASYSYFARGDRRKHFVAESLGTRPEPAFGRTFDNVAHKFFRLEKF